MSTQAVMLLLLFVSAVKVFSSCVPSEYTFCVSHDGQFAPVRPTSARYAFTQLELNSQNIFFLGLYPGAYIVNGAFRAPLTLHANRTYTFEATSSLANQPFALSSHAQHAIQPLVQNVSGANPLVLRGDKLVFTPPFRGTEIIYYGSTRGYAVGGNITILERCLPGRGHVCISQDAQGRFVSDFGEGEVAGARIVVEAGQQLSLEVRGDFSDTPLVISEQAGGECIDRFALGPTASARRGSIVTVTLAEQNRSADGQHQFGLT